jgi:hypothetical protein
MFLLTDIARTTPSAVQLLCVEGESNGQKKLNEQIIP